MHSELGRCRRRPLRSGRLGRPRRGRSPAPRGLPRVHAADPDARRGRAAAAGRPPSRRRVPGHGRLAPPRVEPQGVARRPVRHALRDLRPDARRRRDRLGARRGRRRRDRRPGAAKPIARHYRCTVCRDQRGGSEQRQGPLDDDDLAADRRRRRRRGGAGHACAAGSRRVDGAESLVDELLALHTPRQLVGLAAILDRIESDLRAAPVLAALRLAFLHSILPASRLATTNGRIANLRIDGGHVRLPSATQWRERNPWLAFEDAFRLVRGFVQRLEGGALGPLQARLGEDLRSLGEGTATAVLALSSPSGLRALNDEPSAPGRGAPGPADPPRPRPAAGPARPRASRHRLPRDRLGPGARCGVPAADRRPCRFLVACPVELAGGDDRPGARGRGARDGPRRSRGPARRQRPRGASPRPCWAGRARAIALVSARLADGDDEVGGSSSSCRRVPRGRPRPRTRSNVSLPPIPGGAGDPDLVPGPGLFSAPGALRPAPVLGGRGRPDRDRHRGRDAARPRRARPLRAALRRGPRRARSRRPAPAPRHRGSRARTRGRPPDRPVDGRTAARPTDDGAADGPADRRPAPSDADAPRTGGRADRAVGAPPDARSGSLRVASAGEASPDPVDRLLSLVRDEMAGPTTARLVEIEPGRWWLADRDGPGGGRDPAGRSRRVGRLQPPLHRRTALGGGVLRADRDAVHRPRPARRGAGPGLPRQLPQPGQHARPPRHGRRPAQAQPGAHRPAGDPRRRSAIGSACGSGWLGASRPAGRAARLLGDRLDERRCGPTSAASAGRPRSSRTVDCIWYVRSKVAFLFEVEWTAMLGEPLLRRHARIPANESLVRFLVMPPSGRSSSATRSRARRCCATPRGAAAGTS